jgi:hypothetical protein
MSHRTKSILIGVAAGALLGAAFAWVAGDGSGDAEEQGNPIAALGPGDYFQLAISILTLARQFGGMLQRA